MVLLLMLQFETKLLVEVKLLVENSNIFTEEYSKIPITLLLVLQFEIEILVEKQRPIPI